MIRQMPKFKTYELVILDRAARFLPKDLIKESLERHKEGDFGILSLDDWEVHLSIKNS